MEESLEGGASCVPVMQIQALTLQPAAFGICASDSTNLWDYSLGEEVGCVHGCVLT